MLDMKPSRRRPRPRWSAATVRALRDHLGLTQEELAQELGTRQQTISEWERGIYQPRGAAATLLTLVAERAAFPYAPQSAAADQEPPAD
ncbi:MAG: helix-turn-helix transcriptional regulator [Chloroflexi bacterium]|nr:helix-turn-helix transcriptional regulator [Chloroflexota bacterium]